MAENQKQKCHSDSSSNLKESAVYKELDDSFMQNEEEEEERKKSCPTEFQSEEAAHMNLCMELVQKRKVNAQNAFDLHGTNYLAEFVARKETNMDDAYNALSTCIEIYSMRVDGLHKKCQLFAKNFAAMMDKHVEDINDTEAADQVPEKTAQCQSSKKKKATASSAGITGEKN